MGIEKTQFQIEVTGESKAVSDLKRVEHELDQINTKAGVADRTVGQRLQDLFARGRANGTIRRDGFQSGLMRFGPQGFSLDRGALRGAGGGAGGALLAVAALAHGTARAAGTIADARDYLKAEGDVGFAELTKRLGLGAAEKVLDFFGVHALATNARRLFGGKTEEEAAAEEAQYRQDTFSTAAQLARLSKAQGKAEAAAREARRRALAEAAREQSRSLADLEARKLEVMRKSDEATARELAGIQHETLPVGLPRNLAAIYRARRVNEANSRGSRRAEAALREVSKLRKGQGD